jgi:hypothetical protein
MKSTTDLINSSAVPYVDKKKGKTQTAKQNKPKCGICGKSTRLKKTECCDQWICDDWNPGSVPAAASNSCSQNHLRLTLCGHHFLSKHPGEVNDCSLCKGAFEEEIYTYLKTNEYNINTPHAPRKKKTPILVPDNHPESEYGKCAQCNKQIDLADDSYTIKDNRFYCTDCMPLF